MRIESLIAIMFLAGAVLTGCGESEEGAPTDGSVTGDSLEECLEGEELDVRQGEPGPIVLVADPVTPEAGLIVSTDSLASESVHSAEILVLDQEDAASYDDALPAGKRDPSRFGANVLVLIAETTEVQSGPDIEAPTVPPKLRHALNACVS